MRKVVLASRNVDKVRELAQLFAGLDFEVLSSADFPGLPEVIEDGTTIAGNARRKAMVTAAYTGEIAVADDTSLGVRELNGLPDIFAARFSGPDATYQSNAQLVLDLMANVPDAARQARFASACVWIDPRPDEGEYSVLSPGWKFWRKNPWARHLPEATGSAGWAYWNELSDRRRVWHTYRRTMEADLAGWGHDKARLAKVAAGLFAGCSDALYPGEKLGPGAETEGVRLPDPGIWQIPGPDGDLDVTPRYVPAGLPADAPGRDQCGPVWLEIGAEGKLLGQITRQPLGGSGFGYDPIFRPGTDSRTLAEMPAEEKNLISHRGVAMKRLMLAVKRAYQSEKAASRG
jgi:non-canonical purine NTP pyrophosphatase (RdgB/HAM1 family)